MYHAISENWTRLPRTKIYFSALVHICMHAFSTCWTLLPRKILWLAIKVTWHLINGSIAWLRALCQDLSPCSKLINRTFSYFLGHEFSMLISEMSSATYIILRIQIPWWSKNIASLILQSLLWIEPILYSRMLEWHAISCHWSRRYEKKGQETNFMINHELMADAYSCSMAI